jgi:magnesium chelatase subunit D
MDFMSTTAGPRPAEQRFSTALSCAVLTPALRSVLLLDAPPDRFERAAEAVQAMLAGLTGQPVRRVRVGGMEDDDRLFGGFGLVKDGAGGPPQIAYRPGPLDQSEDRPDAVRLVSIPDLARLSLATARACVTLAGADVAYLERHDRQRVWRPNLFWLAACARADVGQVSHHLLDRFALRLDAAALDASSSLIALQGFLARSGAQRVPAPDVDLLNLKKAAEHEVEVSDEALEHVLTAFEVEPGAPAPSPRRLVALAWLALSLARFDERASTLTTEHVYRAAALVGLRVKQPHPASVELPKSGKPIVPANTSTGAEGSTAPSTSKPDANAGAPSGDLHVDRQSAPRSGQSTVHLPDVEEARTAGSLGAEAPASGDPYPEDSALVTREATPLRLPIQQRSAARAARGTIVGVMRAASFHDLALTSTLIEAAKYQAYRRHALEEARGGLGWQADRIIVLREDLRRYRRIPPPESLLVLVLDYTCLDGWDWGAAVLPYLRDAYAERAAICIVQVGSADTDNELRARIVSARSIREPSIAAALCAETGTATPLAHGLELAAEALRHALQHGREAAVRARLVVVTDGRGNVPIRASREGRIAMPVKDEGVRDALNAAASLKALPRVSAVVIHPSPRLYRNLPVKLGKALGAEIRALVRGEPA